MLTAYWPGYAAAYGALIGMLMLVAFCLQTGRFGWALLGLLAFATTAFFLASSVFGLYQIYDRRDLADEMMRLSQARPSDRIAAVDVGERLIALRITSYLTTGKLNLLDIYNPQLMPASAIARLREKAPSGVGDPRLSSYDARIDLLPLPNNSVSAVYLPQILSTLAQPGDRAVLLSELLRILKPEGHLILAERGRTRLNWISDGPFAQRFKPLDVWRDALISAGFTIRREFDPTGRITLIRADKPSPEGGRQLALNLPYL